MTLQPDIIRDILGEQPRAVFESFGDVFGRTPFMRKFFGEEFQSILDEFRGRAAGQIRAGEFPTQTFGESLEQFPFLQRFLSRSPTARGDISGRLLAPRTTFVRATR